MVMGDDTALEPCEVTVSAVYKRKSKGSMDLFVHKANPLLPSCHGLHERRRLEPVGSRPHPNTSPPRIPGGSQCRRGQWRRATGTPQRHPRTAHQRRPGDTTGKREKLAVHVLPPTDQTSHGHHTGRQRGTPLCDPNSHLTPPRPATAPPPPHHPPPRKPFWKDR